MLVQEMVVANVFDTRLRGLGLGIPTTPSNTKYMYTVNRKIFSVQILFSDGLLVSEN